MNKCMSVIAALVAAIMAQPATASQALAPPEREYTVIINNTCHRDIRVAVHYRHPQRGWVTQGWWDVAGRSELSTGIRASDNRFWMHGDTAGPLQWPPARSRKAYDHHAVLPGNFLLEEGEANPDLETVPFSLKQVPAGSGGLKARFDC